MFRLQGAAFMGAFWRSTPLAARHGLDDKRLWEGLRTQIQKKFGKLGDKVVEDNLRVIRRGFDEVVEIDVAAMPEGAERGRAASPVPSMVGACSVAAGIGDPGRFWEQVGSVQAAGQDVLSDPFTAISAIPAATGVFRDMTGIRQEVPRFVAANCTGCGQCWVQCPDAAIPGLVSEVEDVLRAAMGRPEGAVSFDAAHAAREALRRGDPQGVEGRRVHGLRDDARRGLDRVRAEGRARRGEARAPRPGVRGAARRARDVPDRADEALLRRARGPREGHRRSPVGDDQPGRLQGLQHLRGRVPRARARGGEADRRPRRRPAQELEGLGAPARHARTVRERARPRRGDRRPLVADAAQGRLPLDGGRRRRVHGLRREDERPPRRLGGPRAPRAARREARRAPARPDRAPRREGEDAARVGGRSLGRRTGGGCGGRAGPCPSRSRRRSRPPSRASPRP